MFIIQFELKKIRNWRWWLYNKELQSQVGSQKASQRIRAKDA
jgi:hypothetical protein